MKTVIKGAGTALVTPFTAEGAVDVPALRKIVRHNIDGGIDFLCVLGTTAETPTLSREEQLLVGHERDLPPVGLHRGLDLAEPAVEARQMPFGREVNSSDRRADRAHRASERQPEFHLLHLCPP